jgi:hypothetical protein
MNIIMIDDKTLIIIIIMIITMGIILMIMIMVKIMKIMKCDNEGTFWLL